MLKRFPAAMLLVITPLALTACPPGPLVGVVDQGSYGDSGAYSGYDWPDRYDLPAPQLADDITLEWPYRSVELVQWWGAYREGAAEDDFIIRIYASTDTALPNGPPLYEIHPADVTREPTDDRFEPDGVDLAIYAYTAEIPLVVLQPDRRYFISIINGAAGWFWSTETAGGRYAVARRGEDGAWDTNGLDFAFRLWGRR
jgi:hypothetical protein